jgi:hypothetical protein
MPIDSGVLSQLRDHYENNIHLIAFEDSKNVTPLLALCEQKKIKDGFGRQFVMRFETNEGAAVSASPDIVDEIAGDGAQGGRPSRDRFLATRVSLDAPFVFDRDEILSIEGMKASEQFDVIDREMAAATRRVRNLMAEQVGGNGWGALCQISAISATGGTGTGAVGYVTVPDYFANRFRPGWRLVASTSENNAALAGTPSGAQLRVTGLSKPSGGTVNIGLSGDPTTVWANSSSLWVFRAGNRLITNPSATDSNKKCITGLKAVVDPDSTTLWGVTRTGDPDLTGHEVDCTGKDTHEGLIFLAERAFMYGRKLDTILISGRSWALLNIDKDAVKTIDVEKDGYTIGFKAFSMPTSYGSVDIAADAFLEPGKAWGGPFQDSEYGPKLYYAGKSLINIDNFDGLDFSRRASSGTRDFAGQMFFSGQFGLPTPGMYFKAVNLPTT